MSKRQPVEFHRSQVRFIAEQDGVIEQEFKRKLTDLFQDRKTVTKAYLAAVDYGTAATFTVALCLRAFPSPDRALVNSVSTVFASVFSSAEHLDILFIDDDQEIAFALGVFDKIGITDAHIIRTYQKDAREGHRPYGQKTRPPKKKTP